VTILTELGVLPEIVKSRLSADRRLDSAAWYTHTIWEQVELKTSHGTPPIETFSFREELKPRPVIVMTDEDPRGISEGSILSSQMGMLNWAVPSARPLPGTVTDTLWLPACKQPLNEQMADVSVQEVALQSMPPATTVGASPKGESN
jgi:hypothetical protein